MAVMFTGLLHIYGAPSFFGEFKNNSDFENVHFRIGFLLFAGLSRANFGLQVFLLTCKVSRTCSKAGHVLIAFPLESNNYFSVPIFFFQFSQCTWSALSSDPS